MQLDREEMQEQASFDYEAAKNWVHALESGNYKQAKGTLTSGNGQQHCCLGVACRVLGYKTKKLEDIVGFIIPTNVSLRNPRTGSLDEFTEMKLGIRPISSDLADMNDGGGKTFSEIAIYLRKYYAAWGYPIVD